MTVLGKKQRTINGNFTKRVIALHAEGYDSDFLILANSHLYCLQNNRDFPLQTVLIKLIDQAYDCLSGSFKYIHTVDTCTGDKGMLVADGIFTNIALRD
nr:hypothetical protein [Mucilaginibacter sp. L294]